MSEAESEAEMKAVRDAVERLGEFYDNVQIFVSRYSAEEGTEFKDFGRGNLFARRDQVRDFLLRHHTTEVFDQKRRLRQQEGESGDDGFAV